MIPEDLIAVGYDRAMAKRIVGLLQDTEQLQWYLRRGKKQDCVPVTRVSDGYPKVLRKRLGLDSPGCLWAKGDLTLLESPVIALVGSRELLPHNREFAREAGRQAALQGYVLVSGNARGADRAAQDACLEAGGQVVSVVVDSLEEKPLRKNVLYLSEDGFDRPFSTQRALSRNRVIHSLAGRTLVAQSDLGKGGTWDGTTHNLRHDLSPVFCFDDGSAAMAELCSMGATAIAIHELTDLEQLQKNILNFIDQ